MRISEAVEIAQLLGRTADEVMTAAGAQLAQAKESKIPMCGYIDGTGEAHTFDEADWLYVPHPGCDLGPSIHAVHCRTAGTQMDFMDGWMLYVEYPPTNSVPAESVGRMSLCRIANGITYLAKPTRGYKRGNWHLSGPCASAQDVELQWAMPVLHIAT